MFFYKVSTELLLSLDEVIAMNLSWTAAYGDIYRLRCLGISIALKLGLFPEFLLALESEFAGDHNLNITFV